MATRRGLLTGAGLVAASVPLAGRAQQIGSAFQESGLVGKLQGPTLAGTKPSQFKEAPMLAELVKAGKLPPVAQRVPDEPLVIKPLQQVGRYGGTWRRGFIGPSDGENGNRINATD